MNQSICGWQVILADLSMILFLVTGAALSRDRPDISSDRMITLGAAGAVFRGDQGQSLAPWLDERVHDPREMLTITGRYAPGERHLIENEVEDAATAAERRGVHFRTIVEPGRETDLVAIFAFDRLDKLRR